MLLPTGPLSEIMEMSSRPTLSCYSHLMSTVGDIEKVYTLDPEIIAFSNVLSPWWTDVGGGPGSVRNSPMCIASQIIFGPHEG